MRLGRMVGAWRRPLLMSHVRPDGDAIGALVSMSRICRGIGLDPAILLFDEAPPRYRDLLATERVIQGVGALAGQTFNGIVVLDTCSWLQLEPAAAFLKSSPLPRVVVDHHKTRDSLTGDAGAIAEYAADDTASAASTLVYEWAHAMHWLDGPGQAAAEPLFVGIASDTGWFRFSNTDERTMLAAGALIAAGVRPDLWYTLLYESASAARVRLEAAMLAEMKTTEDGRVSWSSLTTKMFQATGASRADTEDIIHGLQRVAGVVVAVLFAEDSDGRIRVSLRSKSPEVCGCNVDVAAIAQRLGGGGHARAAGVRIAGSLEEARSRVLAAVHEGIGSAMRM